MAFTTDFLKYFGRIDIVHLNPIRMALNERKRTRQFREFAVKGKWIPGVLAGGTANFAANPQYRCDLLTDCGIHFSKISNLDLLW